VCRLDRGIHDPVRVSDDVKKFSELVQVFTRALYSEHVLNELKYVARVPFAGVKESFYTKQCLIEV
jgi:hypothetical protein